MNLHFSNNAQFSTSLLSNATFSFRVSTFRVNEVGTVTCKCNEHLQQFVRSLLSLQFSLSVSEET